MYTQEQEDSTMPARLLGEEYQVVNRHCYRRLVPSGLRQPLILLLIMLMMSPSLALLVGPTRSISQTQSLSVRSVANTSLLECLQVAAPVLSLAEDCQQTLMVHTFALSYGQPFIGKQIACGLNA
jgi:hypothetical protein